MKKPLLVGSVFADDTPLDKKWLNLQLNFLTDTLQPYDHVIYCNKKNPDFKEKPVVLPYQQNHNKPAPSNHHIHGISILLEYFKSKSQEYDWFLFIDSDAFPIKKNWLQTITQKMHGKDIAVILRTENLEQRLQACILLAKAKALNNIDFAVRDIIDATGAGAIERDTSIGLYQNKLRNKALVMMRSNKHQVHPLLCGIYYDMFYHHSSGSRVFTQFDTPLQMRGCEYWNMINVDNDLRKTNLFTDDIMDQPYKWVKDLAGWNPKQYPSHKSILLK
jgi:molybdopterin-guanine dinucleotide biosynthesis protein A